jgi:hypothetical protein
MPAYPSLYKSMSDAFRDARVTMTRLVNGGYKTVMKILPFALLN